MASLNKDLLNEVYDWQGVERCDALNAQDFGWRKDMDTTALAAMDAFVGGYRLREWKPENTSLLNNKNYDTKGGKKYCYFYNTSNQAVDLKERALNANKDMISCANFKQYVGNPDFMTRTFEDDTPDKTHTLSYNKCVIEVDPTAVNTTSLNKFWNKMGKNECDELYRRSSHTLSNVKDAYSACNNLLRYYKKAAPSYDKCIVESNILQEALTFSNTQYVTSNCDFYGQTVQEEWCTKSGASNDLTAELYSQRGLYSQSNLALKTKQAALKDLASRVGNMQRREEELKTLKVLTEKDFLKCSNVDTPQALEDLKLLTTRESDIKTNIASLTTLYAECRSNLEVALRRRNALATENVRIKAENDKMEKDIYLCKVDIDALKQNIITHKENVGKYGSLYQACLAEMSTLIEKNKAMVNRIQCNLIVERDYWLRKCSYSQSNQFADNIKMVKTYTSEGVKLGNSLCGSADPLAADIATMVRTRDNLIMSMASLDSTPCTTGFVNTCCKP